MRRRLARQHHDDEGASLVLVMIVSFLLVSMLGVALAVATSGVNSALSYQNSTQANLAAQSGLAVAIGDMRAQSSYATFPCTIDGGLNATGATSSYVVSVSYSTGNETLPCSGPAQGEASTTLSGSAVPTSAVVTATGTTPHGESVVMAADLAIAASTSDSYEAYSDAIFTPNNLVLSNGAKLYETPSASPPDIYVGQTLTCDNGTLSQGGVTTYQPITLANNCTIDGGLTAAGSVTMENSASVGASVTSYGGGITMSGNTDVGGNAVETNGSISLSNSGHIIGNASATGTISLSGGAYIDGTQSPGDSSLSSEAMPAPVTFPSLDPSVTGWVDAGWDVVEVGDTAAGQPSCSTYFQSISSGANDPFMTEISTVPGKTVIYAPTCDVVYNNAHTFELNDDIALVVNTITFNNSNTFEATSDPVGGSPVDLSILADPGGTCSTSTLDITASNLTDFTSSVHVLFYTEGEVDYANAPSMYGQILACGGFVGTNAFTLYFAGGAGSGIPGYSTAPAPPTITTESKYLVRD
jgi:cytoskeletal protein CcmA (bactofilin family)